MINVSRILMTLILLGSTLSVEATEIKWKQRLYSHYAKEESLESVLKDLMYGENISVSVSNKANVNINFNIEQLPPSEVVQRLASMYQFIWYSHGQVMYVYDMSEIQTATLKLVNLSPKMFTETLKEMNIYDGKYGWDYSEKRGLIHFSGPERLVELVMETAKVLDTESPMTSNTLVFSWIDGKGTKHFSSKPPSSNRNYEAISLSSGEIVPLRK
jgi:type III secretion protein C